MRVEPRPPVSREALLSALAHALSTVSWTTASLEQAIRNVVQDVAPVSVGRLAQSLAATSSLAFGPTPALVDSIDAHPPFERIVRAFQRQRRNLPVSLEPPLFRPEPRFAGLPLPHLSTTGELAAWLGLSPTELDWFAALLAQRREVGPALRHYTVHTIAKASGRLRLIEAPKTRLKAIQRTLLDAILAHVPAHPAAHGFVAGRGVMTAANPHAGERFVLAVDIEDFFPATPVGRVYRLFRHLGYPDAVARVLTGLVTTRTPSSQLDDLSLSADTRGRLRGPHLPQGAPTSPALANLAAFRLDLRLARLAARLDANYTRYADDLVFSGDGPQFRNPERFLGLISTIAADEGYHLRPDKTRVMPSGSRQQVLGLVVNERLNLPRDSYDRLKAILTNARHHGLDSQNREALPHFRDHLNGRIAWFEQVNPPRGLKLRALFDAIPS